MASRVVYEVKVEEVHSGDDLVLLVDLGIDGLYKKVRARLRGVDTPSAYKAKHDTEAGQVRDLVQKLTSQGRCHIENHASGKGGWLVTLFVVDGTTGQSVDVNNFLMSKGYVYKDKSMQEDGQ